MSGQINKMSIIDELRKKYNQAKNFVKTSSRLNFVDRANSFVSKKANQALMSPKLNWVDKAAQTTYPQYAQNRVLNPLKTGIDKFANRSLTPWQRAGGALDILEGGFNATPLGQGSNITLGLTAGGGKSIRTGNYKDIASNVNKNLVNRPDVSGEAFNVQNPYGKLAIDFVAGVASLNPKNSLMALRQIPNVRTVKGGIKAYQAASPAERQAGFAKIPGKDALSNEARKYKSAEEFVRAQTKKDYVSEVNPTILKADDRSVFKTAGEARGNAREITNKEIEIAGRDQKIFDTNKNKSIKQLQDEIVESKKWADENNTSYPRSIQVKEEIIKTKSQLTDIWNKAKSQPLSTTPKASSFTPNDTPTAPEVQDPVKKIIEAITGAKPLSGQQKTLNTQLRKQQFAKMMSARSRAGGEQGYFGELGALKGGAKKVDFEAIRPQLQQGDVDTLFNKVNDANIGDWEKLNAKSALMKLLAKEGASIPTGNELKLLNDVFGSDFTKAVLSKRSTWQKLLGGATEALNLPRALMSSLDLSAPLRQGIVMTSRPKQFFPAFLSMFKQFGSENAYKAVQESIKTRPTYKLMREAKLALTDTSNLMEGREEAFMSNLAEKIPLVKIGVKASNRAYTGFLNKLRADVFDDMVKKAEMLGRDPKEVAGDIAKFVNSATGRGDLGRLNNSATVLNGVFFSPRLMAARVNMLNPVYYAKLDPMVRKEALKSMLTMGATAGTALMLAKAGGAEVGTDPRSADFGKIKVGDTRYDILGGFQQYIVLASRLINGNMVSSTTGKVMSLTDGYKPTTRLDIVMNFLKSKENPVASFASGWAEGTTQIGQEFKPVPELINRFIPMFAQDFVELTEDKGFMKALGMSAPALFGTGVQTYGKQVPFIQQAPSGESKVKWRNPADIGERVVNWATGNKVSDFSPDEQRQMDQARREQSVIKAETDNAIVNVKKQIKKGEKVNGVTELPDGRGMYVKDGEIKYADTREEAELEVAKEEFRKSDQKIGEFGDYVLLKDKAGKVTTITRPEFDSKIRSQRLEIFKEQKNYTEWTKIANEQMTYLKAEYETADPLTQLEIENKIIDLQDQIDKYASYGGNFTKPKKAKKAKKAKTFSMSTSDTFSQFKPKISLVKPTLKALKVTGGTSGTFRRPTAGGGGAIRLKRGA
jgi:hypothetical protein